MKPGQPQQVSQQAPPPPPPPPPSSHHQYGHSPATSWPASPAAGPQGPPPPPPPSSHFPYHQQQQQQQQLFQQNRLENEERQRFQVELEFVQCLGNPNYLNFLAQRQYFEKPEFVNYLHYLQYWKEPDYVKFIKYPICLHLLDLLQHQQFRKEVAKSGLAREVDEQILLHWQHYIPKRHRLLTRQAQQHAQGAAAAGRDIVGAGGRSSDECLDELISRLAGIRFALGSLLQKVDAGATGDARQPSGWPEVLNSLAEVVSQLSTLHRTLRGDKQLRLNELALLPIGLSPQVDPQLLQLTEGRLGLLNHESVPNYLRTQLDLGVEQRRLEFLKTAANAETTHRTSEQMRKAGDAALNSLKQARPDFDIEQSERNQTQRSNDQDTAKLLAAVNYGAGGLK